MMSQGGCDRLLQRQGGISARRRLRATITEEEKQQSKDDCGIPQSQSRVKRHAGIVPHPHERCYDPTVERGS